MASLPPTTLAVSAAVARYREDADLTVDGLSDALRQHGHPLTADDVLAIERRERSATVDDLVALAIVLGIGPVDLLAHVPDDLTDPEEARLGTAVPVDVDPEQLSDWMRAGTGLDRESRLAYCRDQAVRLRILRAHHAEQQEAAAAELTELGELALLEADTGPVIALHERLDAGDWLLEQCDRAQAAIGRRLAGL